MARPCLVLKLCSSQNIIKGQLSPDDKIFCNYNLIIKEEALMPKMPQSKCPVLEYMMLWKSEKKVDQEGRNDGKIFRCTEDKLNEVVEKVYQIW